MVGISIFHPAQRKITALPTAALLSHHFQKDWGIVAKMLRLYCLCAVLCLINADIITYNNHYLRPETPEYLIVPKYSKREVPNWSPGNGRSYIDLSRLTVRSACYVDMDSLYPPPPPPSEPFSRDQCKPVELDMLMFEAPTDKHWMDFWDDKDFCCTTSLIEDGGCPASLKNKLIVPPTLPGAFLRSTTVKPDEPTTLFQGVRNYIY
ncbi:hypothetical protein EON65_36940 [archaeon]|nr:MAG: hypothetical protein EON65_36940 [archaeon]